MDEETLEGISRVNSGFESAGALEIRLDCNSLLQQIEFFLRGKEINTYYDKEKEEWREKLDSFGMPKMNKIGIQAILNKCRALINPQVVQGNLTMDFYQSTICDIRKEIAHLLFINYYHWEIKNKADLKEIPETIMNIVEPFLSRTIGNKERESYAQTIRTMESSSTSSKKWNPFGGKQ